MAVALARPFSWRLASSQLSLLLPPKRSKAPLKLGELTFAANPEIIRLGGGLRPLIRYLSHDAISEHLRPKMDPTNVYCSRFPIAGAGAWLGRGATLIESNAGQRAQDRAMPFSRRASSRHTTSHGPGRHGLFGIHTPASARTAPTPTSPSRA
jgi:hypothetical protein